MKKERVRLWCYLAMANQAGITPVILLTNSDTVPDAGIFREQAEALQRGLDVVIPNPLAIDAVATLAPWRDAGQTVAVMRSSGVGKSTLVNVLANAAQGAGGIRENDSKSHHAWSQLATRRRDDGRPEQTPQTVSQCSDTEGMLMIASRQYGMSPGTHG